MLSARPSPPSEGGDTVQLLIFESIFNALAVASRVALERAVPIAPFLGVGFVVENRRDCLCVLPEASARIYDSRVRPWIAWSGALLLIVLWALRLAGVLSESRNLSARRRH